MDGLQVLVETAETYLAKAHGLAKRRALVPLEAELEPQVAAAFRAQGKAFLKRFEVLQATFPVQEARPRKRIDWEALWDEMADEAADELTRPVLRAVSRAMTAGGRQARRAIGLSGRFDLKSPRAVRYVEEVGARLVKTSDTTREYIRTIVTQGVDEGWSYDQVATTIAKRFEEFAVGRPQEHIDSRAHLVAVTECFPGDVLVAALPLSVAPLPFSGKLAGSVGVSVSPLGDFASAGIVAQRRESAILGATRRWYEGSLVEITTAGGHKLAGTPNHPVLTDRGWIGLGGLVEGDYLICCGGREEVSLGDPDVDNVPAKICEVFHALQARPGTITNRVDGSHMDFHGDGCDGEIEIVVADGELRNRIQATFMQPSSHEFFAESDLREVALAGVAAGQDRGIGFLAALTPTSEFRHAPSGGGVGIRQIDGPFVWGPLGPCQSTRLGHVPDMHTGILEDGDDVLFRDAATLGDALTRFAGDVTPDRIITIDKNSGWTGHVYNLLTSAGAYVANGIIAHNCGQAYEAANYQTGEELRDAGLTMEKAWSTMEDNRVSEGCQQNQDAGWIPFDDEFPGESTTPEGKLRPLRFPGCRCCLLQRRAGSGG